MVATVPQALLNSLQEVPGFDEAAFNAVHQSGAQVTTIRINPKKWSVEKAQAHAPFAIAANVPWSQYGFYLSHRPSFTFDPLFHAGCYYVQEASSLFLEQALLQTTDLAQPLNVLDVCAAPGGKTTHLQSLLSPDSLLVSNDVIRNRVQVLKQNCIKWGSENVVVTNNDPQHLGRLDGFFDVLVVDAPCSGSGLFRRDADAIAEWSLDAVQLCCGRQKRILADVLPALKEGGLLVYSTCSYSVEEDEAIGDWLLQEMGLETIHLQVNQDWNIVETVSEKRSANGYRFFPDKVQGEGFYLAAFRKKESGAASRLKEAKLEHATATEKAALQKWVTDGAMEFFSFPHLYALSKNFVSRYAVLKNYLNVQYAGVALGEVIRDKLVPEHALALSTVLAPQVPVTNVDFKTAIQYLQRLDSNIDTNVKGWQVVAYNGHNLGWINALPNRINNYYPKDWRILKQTSPF
ncbi:MAG TPA: hypothetical protein VM010_06810 [Chitinophagaceae bacterium]|nr:hypothetical protein [Chitinophagaceae bacterium]